MDLTCVINNRRFIDREGVPVPDPLSILPWHIWNIIMRYLSQEERVFFCCPADRINSGLLLHPYLEAVFDHRRLPFPINQAKTVIGPHVETIKIESLVSFLKCGLANSTPVLKHLFLSNCYNSPHASDPRFIAFLRSAAKTVVSFKAAIDDFPLALEFVSILSSLTSLRLMSHSASGDDVRLLLSALPANRMKSLGIKIHCLQTQHIKDVITGLPKLEDLCLENSNDFRPVNVSSVSLVGLSLGSLKKLALLNNRCLYSEARLMFDLGASAIQELNIGYELSFFGAEATYPRVKVLTLGNIPAHAARLFRQKFPAVETFRVDLGSMHRLDLVKCLSSLPKLRFLHLYGIFNARCFKMHLRVAFPVSHLEISFEDVLLMQSVAVLAGLFPELIFLSVGFRYGIIFDVLYPIGLCFPKLGFLRIPSDVCLESILVFLKASPNLVTLYLCPESLAQHRQAIKVAAPELRVLDYTQHPQYQI